LDLGYGKSAEPGAHDDAMSFLFAKSKQKVGQEMVKSTKDLLAKLLSQDGQIPKVREYLLHKKEEYQEQRNNV
jgi:exopolysaccharide biosynthesis protein